MSYILEALKKSSEERARVTVVVSNPDFAPVSTSHERLAFASHWRLIAVLGLAMLIAIAILALRTSDAEVRSDPQEVQPLHDAAPRDAAEAPARSEETAVSSAAFAKQHQAKSPVSAKPIDKQAVRAPHERSRQAAAPTPASAPKNGPAESPEAVAATAPKVGGDMPPELLRQVLAIHIAAHVYSSTPANRMIIVDGKAVREGDILPSGIAVEQITPTGISVSYKGYHADRPIN